MYKYLIVTTRLDRCIDAFITKRNSFLFFLCVGEGGCLFVKTKHLLLASSFLFVYTVAPEIRLHK